MSVSQEAVQPLELGARAARWPHRRRGWLIRRALLAADLVGLDVGVRARPACSTAPPAVDELARSNRPERRVPHLPRDAADLGSAREGVSPLRERRGANRPLDRRRGRRHLPPRHGRDVRGPGRELVERRRAPAVRQDPHLLGAWRSALVSLGRAGARTVCRRQTSYLQNAVIVGCGHVGQTIARKFLNHPEYGVHVVGFLDAEPRDKSPIVQHLPVLGTTAQLRQVVDELRIDRVIIAFSSGLARDDARADALDQGPRRPGRRRAAAVRDDHADGADASGRGLADALDAADAAVAIGSCDQARDGSGGLPLAGLVVLAPVFVLDRDRRSSSTRRVRSSSGRSESAPAIGRSGCGSSARWSSTLSRGRATSST